jgi:Fe2+ transport system protein B
MSTADEPKADGTKTNAVIETKEAESALQGKQEPGSSSATELSSNEKKEVSSVKEKQEETSSSEQDVQDTPDDHATHHVYGIARIILVFGLCSTTFIIGLDQMIIATVVSLAIQPLSYMANYYQSFQPFLFYLLPLIVEKSTY